MYFKSELDLLFGTIKKKKKKPFPEINFDSYKNHLPLPPNGFPLVF
jgi:hypothetical protein